MPTADLPDFTTVQASRSQQVGVLLAVVFLVSIAGWLVLSHRQAAADEDQQQLIKDVNANMWSEYGQGRYLSSVLIDPQTQTYDVRVIHHDLTQTCTYSLSSRIFKCPASIYGGG